MKTNRNQPHRVLPYACVAVCSFSLGLHPHAHGELTIQFGGDASLIDPNSPNADFLGQIGASQIIQWNGLNSGGGTFGASGTLGNVGIGATLTSVGHENLVLTTTGLVTTDPAFSAAPETFATGSPNILGVKGGDNGKFDAGFGESWSFDFNQDVTLKQVVFSALDGAGETIELSVGGGAPVSFTRDDTQMAPVTYGPTNNRFVYSAPGGGIGVTSGDDVTIASLQGSWGVQGVIAEVASPVTTLIGGSLKNGNFNADSGGSAPQFELSFANTTDWLNVGGSGDQNNAATRDQTPQFDGTRNAIFNDATQRIHGMDTGHVIAEGDVFNVSYVWTDGPNFANWDDAVDKVEVRLYTTPDDEPLNATKNFIGSSVSELSNFNNFYQREVDTGFYTATANDAGKKLFVRFNGLDGNDATAPNGVGRLDNFELSVGTVDNAAAAPSAPTGTVLFADTFDRPDTTGLDADSSTTGMSSDVFTPTADTTYAEFRNRDTNTADIAILDNKLQLGTFADANVGIDRNFIDQAILDGGGFAVEVIVDPKTGSNGDNTDRYATIGVGLDQTNATTQATGTGIDPLTSDGDTQIPEQSAFAFLLYDDGQYGFFDSFALTDAGNKDLFGIEYTTEAIDGKQDFLSQIGQTAVLQDEYKVRLEYELTSFDLGSDVTVSAFIDDIQIDLDVSDGIELNPEDRDGYTFTWDGTDQNYIALNGRAQTTVSFDNLLIESLIAADLLAGDFDGSGSVEQGDLNIVLNNWGVARTFEDGISAFDTANVDQEELNAVLNNWGNSLAPALSGAVPEPSIAGLASLIGFASLRRRSKPV
ncbi:MAG: hypothetical protein AAF916_01510 [Planctomycetota bacterium]